MRNLNFNPGSGKLIVADYAHANEQLESFLLSHNPGVDQLRGEIHFGQVILNGIAKTADAVERLVLLAGNIRGVRKVDCSKVSAPDQRKEVEFYEVQQGETLMDISRRFLGNAARYKELYRDNEDILPSPSMIYPGQKIRITLE